ncbi:MAG: Gfo/Idh/MocA family oxidoreductase, partial [candidate division NC10 bacterium]
MRIAFIGVSHWHAPLYYRPAARLAGIRIVAVSDPTSSVAESVGRELEASAYTDYHTLLAEARPDFVFAFGRHCDMAEIALTLIGEGIPFLIEKPGGLNYQQVAAIRDRASAKGLHAGTGFNYRVSDLYKKIQSVIGDDPVTHASFRFIAGGPYRYREAGCAWMLDPKLSGGGSTINLGVHFVDMFRVFTKG